MTKYAKPFSMGLLMGAMMLWMIHGQMTGQSTLSGWALVLFIAVHLVLIAALIVAAFFAARLSPKMRGLLARLHRPSLLHVAVMLCGAATLALAAHLIIHGVS